MSLFAVFRCKCIIRVNSKGLEFIENFYQVVSTFLVRVENRRLWSQHAAISTRFPEISQWNLNFFISNRVVIGLRIFDLWTCVANGLRIQIFIIYVLYFKWIIESAIHEKVLDCLNLKTGCAGECVFHAKIIIIVIQLHIILNTTSFIIQCRPNWVWFGELFILIKFIFNLETLYLASFECLVYIWGLSFIFFSMSHLDFLIWKNILTTQCLHWINLFHFKYQANFSRVWANSQICDLVFCSRLHQKIDPVSLSRFIVFHMIS